MPALVLAPGQYARVILDRCATEASVTLQDPDGTGIRDLTCREYGPTTISVVTAVAGTYRLRIRPSNAAPSKPFSPDRHHSLEGKDMFAAVWKGGELVKAQ